MYKAFFYSHFIFRLKECLLVYNSVHIYDYIDMTVKNIMRG